MTADLSRAKNWKEGGEGAKSGKALMRSPETPPYVRLPLTEERKATFLKNLEICGDVAKAALLTDGNPNTRRTFMRATAKDPVFGELAENALAAFSSRVGDVLRNEFFEGTLVPVTNSRGLVIDPETKKPIWIRKRDPKIVLALAKKHDFGLREIKTTINVDGSPAQADASDPEFRVKSSDLWRLSQQDMETLTRLLKLVHENRREAMAAITDRPDYLDAEDVECRDITPLADEMANSEDNPYDI